MLYQILLVIIWAKGGIIMACKFCDKSVYFDTTWYHSDGGYGDNDYGGVDVNQIAVRVCPNCGEIKVPEKFLEDENAKNEFILNTLASMLVNNVKNMNIVGEDKIRETIDKILRLSDSKYSDKLLEKNGLVQRACKARNNRYKDVLIYKSDYKLGEYDRLFQKKIYESKVDVSSAKYT